MMKLKIAAGILVSIAMMGTAYAATCPTVSITHSQDNEDLTFTSARLKDKGSADSVVVCRYEGKGDLGASSGYRNGTPIKATGTGWKDKEGKPSDDCAVTDGDAKKCSFEEQEK